MDVSGSPTPPASSHRDRLRGRVGDRSGVGLAGEPEGDLRDAVGDDHHDAQRRGEAVEPEDPVRALDRGLVALFDVRDRPERGFATAEQRQRLGLRLALPHLLQKLS
jgi:hypothetical protein